MTTAVAFIILALVVIALALLVLLYQKVSRYSPAALESRLESFEKAQERTERVVKEEIALNRGELGKAASEQRQELSVAFKNFVDAVGQRINDVSSLQKTQLESLRLTFLSSRRKAEQGSIPPVQSRPQEANNSGKRLWQLSARFQTPYGRP